MLLMENKPDAQAWRDLWVKCLIMVYFILRTVLACTHLCPGCDAMNTTVDKLQSIVVFLSGAEVIIVRSCIDSTSAQLGSLLVDSRFSSCHSCQLLPNHMGGISHRCEYLVFRYMEYLYVLHQANCTLVSSPVLLRASL